MSDKETETRKCPIMNWGDKVCDQLEVQKEKDGITCTGNGCGSNESEENQKFIQEMIRDSKKNKMSC